MGHHGGPGRPDGEVLQLLRRALSGHHLQHHLAAQDPFLHRQPHHPLRLHLFPLRASLLLALGLRGESQPVHIHRAVPRRLLPTAVRNHTSNLPHSSTSRKIFAFHDDSRVFFGVRDHCSAQCKF